MVVVVVESLNQLWRCLTDRNRKMGCIFKSKFLKLAQYNEKGYYDWLNKELEEVKMEHFTYTMSHMLLNFIFHNIQLKSHNLI